MLSLVDLSEWKCIIAGCAAIGIVSYYFLLKRREDNQSIAHDVVLVHSFPPTRTIVNPSMYSLKLQTFLRMAKIPHQDDVKCIFGSKGKAPWTELNGEIIDDSCFIIEHLSQYYQVTIDDHLSQEDHAIGRMMQKTFEESTYILATVRNRLIEDKDWFLGTINMSWIIKMSTWWLLKRGLEAALRSHGFNKHSQEEIQHIVEQDIKSFSVLLGEDLYLFGDKPCSYDAALFSFTANIIYGLSPTSWPYILIRDKFSNLARYTDRLKSEIWDDWDKLLDK